MELLGREQEQEQLRDIVNSERPEFVAVYGRRRVGKTFLVREFFHDDFAFYVSGVLNGNAAEQKKAFSRALEQYGLRHSIAKDWMDFFFELEDLLQSRLQADKRCVVFIDELPCFDTVHSGFIRALDHFWNTWASRYNQIKFIVCGSAASWMIDKLVNDKGGLHNRLTAQIYLRPFTLSETERYLRYLGLQWEREMIAEAYMIFGGVPYYYSLLRKSESMAKAVDRLYFNENAPLSLEFERLFSSLFRSSEPYINIIKVLARQKQGMTRDEIAAAVHSETSGRLSQILNDLVNCDFIRLYYVRKQNKVSKRDGIYALKDLFSLFHLHFQEKNCTSATYWEDNMQSPTITTWQGLSFEQVVMLHIPQLKQALGISGMAVEYYSWRSRKTVPGSQIDLILDRADKIDNICEIKFSNQEYLITKSEADKIKIRTHNFLYETGSRHGTHLTFITPYGLRPNQYSSLVVNSLTLNDLFR